MDLRAVCGVKGQWEVYDFSNPEAPKRIREGLPSREVAQETVKELEASNNTKKKGRKKRKKKAA